MTAAVVVKGSDPTLRANLLAETVERFLGSDDRTLGGAGLGEGERADAGGDDPGLAGPALDALRTPPFGTSRRIVVVRGASKLSAGEARSLADYLASPSPDSVLVLEGDGKLPAALAKACKEAGAEEVGESSATADVLVKTLREAKVHLDRPARELVLERLGEDAGRVPGLVELLAAAHGEGADLGVEDVEPYLGREGAVPVFHLTKAIDAGDHAEALAVLERFLGSMGMHPLQVMAVLHSHFRRLLRLDDPSVRSEADAVTALGGKVKPYPARLAWQHSRALGTEGVREAFSLLARADVDLRGGTGAPEEAVVEMLVTRLAMLSKRAQRAGSRRR